MINKIEDTDYTDSGIYKPSCIDSVNDVDRKSTIGCSESEKKVLANELVKVLSNEFFFIIMMNFVKSSSRDRKGVFSAYYSLEGINSSIKNGFIEASSYIYNEYKIRAWFGQIVKNIKHTDDMISSTLEVMASSTLDDNTYVREITYSVSGKLAKVDTGSKITGIQLSGSINTYVSRYLKQNFFNLSCGSIDLDEIRMTEKEISREKEKEDAMEVYERDTVWE